MAKTILACLLLSLPLVHASGIRPMIVIGASMEPTLRHGELVLLHCAYYHGHPLERDDVLVFRWKGRTYVKRVYALAGDTVRMLNRDGYETPVPPVILEKARRLTRRSPAYRLHVTVVPPGHFYSLGDSINASTDSRDLGPIPTSAILGRVCPLFRSTPGASPFPAGPSEHRYGGPAAPPKPGANTPGTG